MKRGATLNRLITIAVGFPGVTSFCQNLEAVAGTEHIVYQPGMKVDIPEDAVVLFGAYDPSYRNLIFKIRERARRVGVCWTSSGGEMESSAQGVEIVQLERLLNWLKDGTLDFLLFTDPGLAKVFEREGVSWIPCPIAQDLVRYEPTEKIDGVGLFCPSKPNKNIFNQILAVYHIQKRTLPAANVMLYTNARGYERALRMIGVGAEIHPWLPREEYHRLLARMRVNLDAEWAGCYFVYQPIEAALLGTPSVVAAHADYYPIDELKVHNIDNPAEIAEKIELALEHPELGLKARGSALKLAERNNREARRICQAL